MEVFFAGQSSFGNRGCEALVRGTVGIIRDQYPDSRFTVPSLCSELDQHQWPDSTNNRVTFVSAMSTPLGLRAWNFIRRKSSFVEQLGRPSFRVSRELAVAMGTADWVVMTGGDNISLDYDLPSLYFHAALIDNAKRLGKRTALWAASVGPFTSRPKVESLMKRHLCDYDVITVRETASLKYLQELGIERVKLVADPAFVLDPESFDVTNDLPEAPEGLLGLNISPLIRKFRKDEVSRLELDADIAAFVRHLLTRTGYGVILIPHVMPLDGSAHNNDFLYMRDLVSNFDLASPRLTLLPVGLNAPQLKHVISKCRFFIGARTHATIAAMSMRVPTISIAYSVKARGINKDLFGDCPVVLETPMVNTQSLVRSLGFLEQEEDHLKSLLSVQIPIWKNRAYSALEGLRPMGYV